MPESLVAPRVATIAARLAEAESERIPIDPITSDYPDITREEAYEVQLCNVKRRVGAGARVCGHKIGLTAKAMQELFGIDEPDYGHLLDDMFVFEGAELRLSRFIVPHVEVEPAFILKRRLEGPGLTVADVVRATEYVLPALEIIDSRIRDWSIGLADTITDNGSSAALVLGGRPVELTEFDPRRLEVELRIDREVVERGNTAAILGNPVTAITWLANKLGAQGVGLEEGHVVLPGTCIRAVPVTTPVEVVGVFERLGEVAVRFVD